MVNLNKDGLFLGGFHYGQTQNVEVKLGRKIYMLDVDKYVHSAFVEFYRKVSADRQSYSKYDREADLVIVMVQPDAVLTRDFFENIREIKKAQDCYIRYERILAM